jgi:hypothetical protein
MGAKEVMRSNFKDIIVTPHSKKDISNMKMCLVFKLMQHPKLIEELINTGDLLIVEDVTTRGNVGGNLFWGAMLVNNEWVGENTLGKIWMDLRNEHKLEFNIISYTFKKNSMENIDRRFELSNKFTEMGMALKRR